MKREASTLLFAYDFVPSEISEISSFLGVKKSLS